MDPRAILTGFLGRPRIVALRHVLDVYGQAPGGLLANGLAFTSLFAAIPTTLLVLGVGGWIAAGDAAAADRLAAALAAAFPPLAELIDGAVSAISDGAALTSVLGVIGVIWTVSQIYGALDVAFARIFVGGVERNKAQRTVRGLLVVLLIGGAIVAFAVLVSVASLAEAIVPAEIPVATAVIGLVGSTPFLVALAVASVLATYRTLPPSAPHWRSAFVPSVVAGVTILILSQAFTALVPRLVGVASLAGPLASAFVALAWLSFTFQVLLYGAAWVRVREEALDASLSAGLVGAAAPTEPGGSGQ